MKQNILNLLSDPRGLEHCYRNNREEFKKVFLDLYPEIRGNPVADCWKERFDDSEPLGLSVPRKDLWLVGALALLCGLLAKMPFLLGIDPDYFYPRTIGFIAFLGPMIFFALKEGLALRKAIGLGLFMLALVAYIHWLPNNPASDTLVLASIHLVFFLWAFLGFLFTGGRYELDGRLQFLRYTGNLVVLGSLLLSAGGLASAITIGLFSLIGYQIADTYMENVGIFGLAALPVVATWINRMNPLLVGRISPLIARIFSPLVLVMLSIYLAAMGYAGKNPYHDREFLMLFNVLLLAVLALIFFAIPAEGNAGDSKIWLWILFLLAVLTAGVNVIALSAILFRLSSWGVTPNRLAVLVANGLIMITMLRVTWQLLQVLRGKESLESAGVPMGQIMPILALWALFVTLAFPFLFAFK